MAAAQPRPLALATGTASAGPTFVVIKNRLKTVFCRDSRRAARQGSESGGVWGGAAGPGGGANLHLSPFLSQQNNGKARLLALGFIRAPYKVFV